MIAVLLRYILPFFSGYAFASLGVYWVHRLMHFGVVHAKPHIDHHKRNTGQGWFSEFWDYLQPGSIVILIGAGFWYFLSWKASICWIVGNVLCLVFSAFTHEVSHTNPSLIFWSKRPIHYFHHKNKEWNNNFGFTTIFWDVLFGTYKDDPEWTREKVNYRDFLKVKW
jgi:sterol desaturase/sphingolipid hydroxylase (fatty acid hydroxylase superfamily)